MLGLTFAYLRDRKLTTALNVVLLGLAVAMLVILLSFSSQLAGRFERDARGIDLVVGAKGSPLQLILSSIYQIDAPTGNIPLDSLDMLRRDPSVALAVPLALGDNFRGFRIVGTVPGYLDLYGGEIAEGRMFAATGEAVLGSEVARRTGATLGQRFVGGHGLIEEGAQGHDQHPMTTVGTLAPTGSVVDRLILVSVDSVWDVHGIAHDEAGHDEAEHEQLRHDEAGHDEAEHEQLGHDEHEEAGHHEDEHDAAGAASEPVGPALARQAALEPELTAILVSYRSAFGAVRLPSLINRQTNLQAAVPAIETTRLLSLLGVGFEAMGLFAWLLALIGGLAIFVALLNAAAAREGDLALLRVMGARPGAIFGTIVTEGVLTAACGALLGLIAGHGALAVAAASFDRLRELGLDPLRCHPGELVIVGAVILIGALAALIPAARVFRADLADTLARTQ